MKKDLLKLLDLTEDEILHILDTADRLKAEWKTRRKHDFPPGKTLAMIFSKNSTRTRVSFETGIYQLGGQGIFLSSADSQLGRGEPIQDTARVLSRYCDCIMIRTFEQEEVEKLAQYASIPVINGLTDFEHPCQVLADLMTIREYKKKLKGLKICYIGDGNNMANSIIAGCLKCGINVSAACPDDYRPHAVILDFAVNQKTAEFELTNDPAKAAAGADVIFTDVWASMGMEQEAEKRKEAFRGYQVNDEIMALASPAAWSSTACRPTGRGDYRKGL